MHRGVNIIYYAIAITAVNMCRYCHPSDVIRATNSAQSRRIWSGRGVVLVILAKMGEKASKNTLSIQSQVEALCDCAKQCTVCHRLQFWNDALLMQETRARERNTGNKEY